MSKIDNQRQRQEDPLKKHKLSTTEGQQLKYSLKKNLLTQRKQNRNSNKQQL